MQNLNLRSLSEELKTIDEKLQKQYASLKKKNLREKFPTRLNIFCTYISFQNIVATHRNNMSLHIVNRFCGRHTQTQHVCRTLENRHTLILFVAHIGSNCGRHTQTQHVSRTQETDTHRYFFLAHITSNCGRHTQTQHVWRTKETDTR